MEEEILINELKLAYVSTYSILEVPKITVWKLFKLIFKSEVGKHEEYVAGKMIRLEYIDEYLVQICKKLGYHHRLCRYMEYNTVRLGCDEDTLNLIRSVFHTEKHHGEEYVAAFANALDDDFVNGLDNRVRKKTIDNLLDDL